MAAIFVSSNALEPVSPMACQFRLGVGMSLICMETTFMSIRTIMGITPIRMQSILWDQAPFVLAVRIQRQMPLTPEEPVLSLPFFVDLSHTSPKRLGNISEADQLSIKVDCSFVFHRFSHFFHGLLQSILAGCWGVVVFLILPQLNLTSCSKPVASFKLSLNDLRNPLWWNDSRQGFPLFDLISSALTATPSMCLPR